MRRSATLSVEPRFPGSDGKRRGGWSWDRGAPKEYFAQEDADGAIGCAERVLRFCDGLLAGGG